ncbi:F420-dependent methylene-tetrahydromethanopterin reductase [Streptosporangium nondiastaticum]|uniref:F420-dependent methylene-tetrahydromethanopterin reductase n=1 Tax=Streptosporangium nondiastaticum TaxID=35764 RepID=A0A9X7JNX1_9ACTN|nr:NtaA/DmoA family FMN-dependent monooxygenase [Streptosporangium nondiastaticum]PSJ26926.1 F420-dependent methylene-tetrahydromethanopterin reductase [Streptosporangium nondiastaticum]
MTAPGARQRRQMHLAVQVPGAGSTTVWAGPDSGSHIGFPSFRHLAATAERGLFDFLLLAEGLRLPEHKGRIHDLDAAGRPEPLTVLSALAAVTGRIGLAATADTTFHEPYELARRLASLDHLSDGRAAWHVVASSDAFTGENFRCGGRPDWCGGRPDRSQCFARAAEFVTTARELWDSWTPGGVPRPFAHHGRHFSVSGTFDVARSPQGHPVVIRSGESAGESGGHSHEEREFAASTADVFLAGPPGTPEAGQALYADVKRRLAAYGRRPEDLKVMPGVTFALGDTDAEAQENAAEIRKQQVSPQGALFALEQVWGRDLSGYDPDGPLPRIDPDPAGEAAPGPAPIADRLAVAARWRAVAEAKGLSIRQTVIETTGRQSFIGTPASVAAQMVELVTAGAADGFVLRPHFTPGGLDEFAGRVVPLLQERGAFRTEYTGATLREHLGLPLPVWKG